MEEAYSGFAKVYDEFMDNVPYGEWAVYLKMLLGDYQIEDGLLLDLGCGTGTLTECMSKSGFEMIGIDNSEEMLEIAVEKKEKSGSNTLYLLQDMRSFELYGTVRAVFSICDSINYITSTDDLLRTFQLVNNYLDKDGIFIFDLNTEYKYQEILAENTFAENREECSFIWENYYDLDSCQNEYDLTLFIRDKDFKFQKYEEIHYQRAYSLSVIQELLQKAGMQFLHAYDAFTKNEPGEQSERIYVIAKEGRQEGKKYL